jgi:hypothetical protein
VPERFHRRPLVASGNGERRERVPQVAQLDPLTIADARSSLAVGSAVRLL